MKLKKLLSLIFIIPLFCICLVGCKKSETSEQDSDDWIMVYEITFSYLFDGTSSSDYIETQTYTSYIEWTLNNTETTKEEYDSYPDNQGNSNTYLMGN